MSALSARRRAIERPASPIRSIVSVTESREPRSRKDAAMAFAIPTLSSDIVAAWIAASSAARRSSPVALFVSRYIIKRAVAAGFFSVRIEHERSDVGADLIGNILQHCARRSLSGGEHSAWVAHQAKLNSKAEPIVLSPAKANLKPVSRRQRIVSDEAFLIGRHTEKFLPILIFEKLPSAHRPNPSQYSMERCQTGRRIRQPWLRYPQRSSAMRPISHSGSRSVRP